MKKLLMILVLCLTLASATAKAEQFPVPGECVSEWVLGARYVHRILVDVTNCQPGEECPILWEDFCRCDSGAYEAVILPDGTRGYEDITNMKYDNRGVPSTNI